MRPTLTSGLQKSALTALLLLLPANLVAAECGDVWLVSSRHLPETCGEPEDPGLRVERLDGSHWSDASLDELAATSAGPVVFFIHGNRYDPSSARRQGLELSHRLGCCGAGSRTIVYSWPSDRDGPPLADARSKYRRTRSEGWYFAAVLRRLDPESTVGIVGYSYGATIALHGLKHVGPAVRRGHTGLVMVTPAVAAGAVHPLGSLRESVETVDRLTILVNSRDEALRFFRFVDPCHQEALGFTGMSLRNVPAGVAFQQLDVAGLIGKEHSMQPFLDSRRLSCLIAEATNGP
jgi:pimeloyl-ACP methyl ester carboxylesterase